MKEKILIVEDARSLADAVSLKLKNEGFDVVTAYDGSEALDFLSKGEFSVVLLDINIPKLNGFEVAEAIKELGYKCKVIALTARDGIEDKLKGFDLGFDDYMVKPFDMRELVARVKAVNRQSSTNNIADTCFHVRDLRIDVNSRKVLKDSKEVQLTKLEFDLFCILLQNSPSVVETTHIIDTLWGDDGDLLTPPIRSHIKNLRRKIGDEDFSLIITIPGVGYKIEESVECHDH